MGAIGCMGETPKQNEEIDIESRHEAHRLYGKQLMYSIISRAFIDIPGIIVLYIQFPQTPKINISKNKR